MKIKSNNPLISKFDTFPELVKFMIESLKKAMLRDDFKLDMDSYGYVQEGICMGCAATASLAELMDGDYLSATRFECGLGPAPLRWDALDVSVFECLINGIRTLELNRISFRRLNYDTSIDLPIRRLNGLTTIEADIENSGFYKLPVLRTNNVETALPRWDRWVSRLNLKSEML